MKRGVPGNEVLTAGCQLCQRCHEHGEQSWWVEWGAGRLTYLCDLKQHCLKPLKKGRYELHGTARVIGKWQILPDYPHLQHMHTCLTWPSKILHYIHIIKIQNDYSFLLHHMCVEVLFSVDVGSGAGKFQQLLVLINNQRRVQLAQCLQVCAEHSTAHSQPSGTKLYIHFI